MERKIMDFELIYQIYLIITPGIYYCFAVFLVVFLIFNGGMSRW
jgi:hypothetical protein